MDDERIIDLYWRRDEYAITATCDKYGAYCRSIANNILSNNEDAEECINDTWLHAWNAIPPHKPARLPLFLGKITRELSLNRYKAQFAHKRGSGAIVLALDELDEATSSKNSPVEQLIEFESVGKAISIFLRKQPDKSTDIFIRRYYHFCSIKQISSEFSISESKAKSILFRMRKKLRTYLESEDIYL
jgi:RNA polymerase sigma-70 factor (ECF subfamily)